MSLLDHFRPPLSERRPWDSFQSTWASALADWLNDTLLPAGYIALEQIHSGAALEIDVATYAEPPEANGEGGTATVTRTVWIPATAPLILSATFPPSCTVEIVASEGGRTLVAAIELVSPANKDRPVTRRQFAAKCATYLSRGIGLIVVDVVTTRQFNLHNEMIELMGGDVRQAMPLNSAIYAVGYRPLQEAGAGRIEAWPQPLQVGEVLPTLPLSLAADVCLPLDLEAAYSVACRKRRLEEAAG